MRMVRNQHRNRATRSYILPVGAYSYYKQYVCGGITVRRGDIVYSQWQRLSWNGTERNHFAYSLFQ
ncbi:MAG: hypothetical protein Q4F97_06555 [Bacteroidales bacterium]|nr:hypothetical protein [Bacteroidales bacterium]